MMTIECAISLAMKRAAKVQAIIINWQNLDAQSKRTHTNRRPKSRKHKQRTPWLLIWTTSNLEPYATEPPKCPRCITEEMERQITQTGPWRFGEGKK